MTDFEPRRREFLKLSAAAASALVAGAASRPVNAHSRADAIVRYAVHPTIGIARVGNSKHEFYLAPELPGEIPSPPGGFKDATGAIKRQATRFRVYGYDAWGRVVSEITADEAEIVWSVHVANRKAAWYEFQTALDIPSAVPTPLRNATYQGAAREELVIDPGPRTIAGRNQSNVRFDGGSFLGQPVFLGELRTDNAGRLLFLSGHGDAYNPTGVNVTTFANNDGWCDDIADGPVRATVTIDGRSIEAKPAWVVAAPPNFGPSIRAAFTTMHDVVEQVMIESRLLRPYWRRRGRVSFTADILPLFLRLADMQWVNEGMFEDFGFGAPFDLSDPEFLLRLADPSPLNRAFRTAWFKAFRNPAYRRMQPDKLPPMYGDAVALPAVSPRQWLAPLETQYDALKRWARGRFIDDFDPFAPVPQELSALPARHQAVALDRAALEPVLGGPFHPGTEITWILRTASLYDGLFRLKAAPPGQPTQQDWGEQLTPQVALSSDGPLSLSGPGDITRWMATPWMTDTASCRSGYQPEINPFLPTFWPARVPNHILTEAAYNQTIDPQLPRQVREEAFATREDWLRFITRPNYVESLDLMIQNWPKLGFVTRKPGPGEGIGPEVVKVETELGFLPEEPIVDVHASEWAEVSLHKRWPILDRPPSGAND
jgi:L-Lysine epsilon oxidase N-terminal/L-lysine epsilon oxidase C-terminal domain